MSRKKNFERNSRLYRRSLLRKRRDDRLFKYLRIIVIILSILVVLFAVAIGYFSLGRTITTVSNNVTEVVQTTILSLSTEIYFLFAAGIALILFLRQQGIRVLPLDTGSVEGLRLQKEEVKRNKFRYWVSTGLTMSIFIIGTLLTIWFHFDNKDSPGNQKHVLARNTVTLEIPDVRGAIKSAQKFFEAGTLDGFNTAEYTLVEGAGLTKALCTIIKTLSEHQAAAALVIGRHDKFPLSTPQKINLGSNSGLAQKRADRVIELLSDTRNCEHRLVLPHDFTFISIIGGPRVVGAEKDQSSETRRDRSVSIYGLTGNINESDYLQPVEKTGGTTIR